MIYMACSFNVLTVGLLLLESILLLGYFSLFHAGNQAVLRWGKSPTILHKVCDLPFVFFSDPELMPILAAALTAVCYGCDQNRSVLLQEISSDMLRSLLRSCRAQGLATSDSVAADGSGANNLGDSTQISPNTRNSLSDISKRLSCKEQVCNVSAMYASVKLACFLFLQKN